MIIELEPKFWGHFCLFMLYQFTNQKNEREKLGVLTFSSLLLVSDCYRKESTYQSFFVYRKILASFSLLLLILHVGSNSPAHVRSTGPRANDLNRLLT